MASLQDAMIILTTKEMEEAIYRMIHHALDRTLIVVMPLENTEVMQEYDMNVWIDQAGIPRLYIVWNQKPAVVNHAIFIKPIVPLSVDGHRLPTAKWV